MNKHDNNFDVLRLFPAWLVLLSHSYPLSGNRIQICFRAMSV